MSRQSIFAKFLPCIIGAAVMSIAGNSPAHEISVVSGEPEQCVSLARIDRTDVVDDHNILFYMRGGDIYLNHLPYRCPGLEFEESFMYRTSLNQLCNVDIITVLRDAGFGFTSGISCGLGTFKPITETRAEELKQQRD